MYRKIHAQIFGDLSLKMEILFGEDSREIKKREAFPAENSLNSSVTRSPQTLPQEEARSPHEFASWEAARVIDKRRARWRKRNWKIRTTSCVAMEKKLEESDEITRAFSSG